MDIVISIFAVLAAAGCLLALMSSHWKATRNQRLAEARIPRNQPKK